MLVAAFVGDREFTLGCYKGLWKKIIDSLVLETLCSFLVLLARRSFSERRGVSDDGCIKVKYKYPLVGEGRGELRLESRRGYILTLMNYAPLFIQESPFLYGVDDCVETQQKQKKCCGEITESKIRV